MNVAIGCDHAGFILKDVVINEVKRQGHTPLDLGTNSSAQPVDYPDYARAVAQAILSGKAQSGIVICGSGVGVCIAANKFKGIRAGLCHDTYSAHQAVEHDDINVLCLGARIVGEALAFEIAEAFLKARFSGEERHARRLKKVEDFEKNN